MWWILVLFPDYCADNLSYLKVCADFQYHQRDFVCVCVLVAKFSMLCLYNLKQVTSILNKLPSQNPKVVSLLRSGIISASLSDLTVTGWNSIITTKQAAEEFQQSFSNNGWLLIVKFVFSPTWKWSRPAAPLGCRAVTSSLSSAAATQVFWMYRVWCCFLLHLYLCCFLLTVLGCWVLQAVPDIYSQIKPLIKALKVDLVSVLFCVNWENMERSNSQDISVLQGNVDFGPNNVDNLPLVSVMLLSKTPSRRSVFIIRSTRLLFVYCFQCFKKIPSVSQTASWTFIRTSRRQNDNQAHRENTITPEIRNLK